MTGIFCFSKKIDDQYRRELLYDGHILVFKSIKGVHQLQQYASTLSQKMLETKTPQTAHHHMQASDYISKVDKLQRFYSHDPKANELFKAMFADLGIDLKNTYWCRTTLRVQPELEDYIDRCTSNLCAHRDTWYSNIYQQNNWWMPIYPLEPGRTLVIYPNYWKKPIKNTSHGFNLYEFRAARERLTNEGASFSVIQNSYPLAAPDEPIDTSSCLRIIVEPGDIMNFSPVHLHQGIKNTTDEARFSTEVRTVNIDDIRFNRQAQNIDGESTGIDYENFYGLLDNKNLIEMIGN
jgi:hypothetical protein